MKKSLFIIMLAAMQSACSSQPAAPESGNSLISFAEIAGEISVGYEKLDANNATEQAVALSLAESP